jgi:hypothetical protein
VYRYEIDNGIPNGGSNAENGNPTCSSSTPINNPNRDRRLLVMAVVNCQAWGIAGRVGPVNVVAYVQMFLTEPVGLDSTGSPTNGNLDNIYGEVAGVIKPGDKTGVLHQSPALYR